MWITVRLFFKKIIIQILIKLIVLCWITVKTIFFRTSSCINTLALLSVTRFLIKRMIKRFMSKLSIFILKFNTVINLMTLSNTQNWHSTSENFKNIYVVIMMSFMRRMSSRNCMIVILTKMKCFNSDVNFVDIWNHHQWKDSWHEIRESFT